VYAVYVYSTSIVEKLPFNAVRGLGVSFALPSALGLVCLGCAGYVWL
jgi:hypothetical protein